ncbi:acyl-CoA N-acyltransferase [Tricharina praecox]|uniref:acyl-CoA N-acyltransferase n=1 Tax=Tricharina praecox TaxID=43433 RepID=UPI00221E8E5E|nr:acyl-CoA N-acyltransferase [Tricharina praecox]KAI5849844.1 acyl-CoA N-acyltransferase [Tricharina praecox]
MSPSKLETTLSSAALATGESEPLLPATAAAAAASRPPFTYTLRPATLADVPSMASLAACAYLSSSFSDFLSPGRFAYISEHAYGYTQRVRYRMLSPRCVSIIAVSSSGLPVGYAQFVRHGEDAAAKEVHRNGNTWAFQLKRAWLYARFAWDYITFTDRSMDQKALKVMMAHGDMWKGEQPNRWHAQSVVVSPGHQRRGIGKALMRGMMERAGSEGVPLGLEASPDGELLYTKLGFELKRRFEIDFEGLGKEIEEDRGGLMIYYPPGCERE